MKKSLYILFLFLSIAGFSQVNEQLSSDRPGQALSTNIVGTNVFQLQPGVDFTSNVASFVPNIYLRYGLSDAIEINSNFAYLTGNSLSELAAFDLGARFRLNKPEASTTAALQTSISLPVSHLDFASLAVVTISGNLLNNLSWTGNFGANFNEDFNAVGLFVANLGYSISDKAGIFIETFSSASTNKEIAFDTGFYYLLNNNVQLDAFFGDNQGFFFSIGATIRLLPKQ